LYVKFEGAMQPHHHLVNHAIIDLAALAGHHSIGHHSIWRHRTDLIQSTGPPATSGHHWQQIDSELHAIAEWLWPLALGQAVPWVLPVAMGRLARAAVAVLHAPRLLPLGRMARLHAMKKEWLWPLAVGQAVPSVLALGRLARAAGAVSPASRLLAVAVSARARGTAANLQAATSKCTHRHVLQGVSTC
jgi:hypothetical protein